MDLILRKVDHINARDNYRVILKLDDEEVEIGSIGVKTFTSSDVALTWGIDTVVPLRAHQSEGRGADRRDCMVRFRQAWESHCAKAGWLDEFLAMKRQRRALRTPKGD
jgi:hypothetical protein